MKLLFVQGGTRIKKDVKGNLYTDGNFNVNVWNRYVKLTDEKMSVIFREDSKKYTVEEATEHLNYYDASRFNNIILPDLYSPKKNFVSPRLRSIVKAAIFNAVQENDVLIIRSLGNVYVEYAIEAAKKYNKPYLVEVTGVYWDNSWYHSLLGKVMAPQRELSAKKCIKNAPYAVYVTNEALQLRYPCLGKTLGCSDVELKQLKDEILEAKLAKLSSIKKHSKIILGTAGFVSLKTKGQHDVIRALGELKKEGINNFEYQLIGLGDDSFLRGVAKRYNVEDNVVFLGGKTHDEVFKWLDNVDIYLQPSYQEGLCRAIIEAMSRACPVICSNAGGNDELIDSSFVFRRGNISQFKECLKIMLDGNLQQQARINFEKATKYEKDKLDAIRTAFYQGFITEAENKEGGL